MAQLVERLLPVPEVCGSNPVTGKKIYGTFTVNCIKKTKIKKKGAGNGPFLKKRMIRANAQRKCQKDVRLGYG